MAKQVTILDVAAAAGVSRQTVTRAVNGMADISGATRQRVLETADRLGYRPSRFARGLVTRDKTFALGLVVASFRNPYYTDIAADFLAATQSRGWQLIVGAPDGDGSARGIELMSTQVDVIVGHFGPDDQRAKAAAGGLPIVNLESPAALRGIHSVEVDIAAGISAAIAELRARGVRRFGMVDSSYSTRTGGPYVPSPRRGFFERAAAGSISGIVAGEESITGGGSAFIELLRQHPDTDAVLMFNDLMAVGAVSAAHAQGIVIPDAVRVIGIDGLALGEAVDPPLTTISLGQEGLAGATLQIVDQLAAADFRTQDSIRMSVEPRVLWRRSA